MLNVKEMNFEEFIEFGEKKTGSKCDDAIKGLLKIIFDSLKSGAWSQDDLSRFTDAMKKNLNQKGKGVVNV